MIWDRTTAPEAAVRFLKSREGFSATVYDDGFGYLTQGYGSRQDVNGKPLTRATPPVTKAEAEQVLLANLGKALRDVAAAVKVELADHQAGALVLLAFNLGDLKVAAPTLMRFVNARDLEATCNQWRLYNRSGGKVSLGLVRRRWCEAAIFCGAAPEGLWAAAERTIVNPVQWPPMPRVGATA